MELAVATSRRGSTETNVGPRRAAWAEADSIIEPFIRAADEKDPRHLRSDFNHALMIRDRAETVVELLKAIPNDSQLVEDARTQARLATELLSTLAGDVRHRSNQAAGGDPKKSARLADLDESCGLPFGRRLGNRRDGRASRQRASKGR